MKMASLLNKALAVALIVSVQMLASPAPAAPPPAALSGQILSAEAYDPVPGVVVRMVDPGSGDLYTSAPTNDKGEFEIDSLPPSVYALSVQQDEGVFLAGSHVVLAPGEHRSVQVALYAKEDKERDPDYKYGPWENPWTATFLALGIAAVVGWGISEAFGTSEKKYVTSPTNP